MKFLLNMILAFVAVPIALALGPLAFGILFVSLVIYLSNRSSGVSGFRKS